MAKESLRRNLDEALGQTPEFPDPKLLSRTMAVIAGSGVSDGRPSRRYWRGSRATWKLPRSMMQLLAAAIALVVVAGVTFVVVASHKAPVPAHHEGSPIIFPTKMLSPTLGWAVTQAGNSSPQVWRTSDGGIGWTEGTPPWPQDRVNNADTNFFLDDTHAWITVLTGGNATTPNFYLLTLRTVDGGKNWERGEPVVDPFRNGMVAQDFIDAANGWLVVSSDDLSHEVWPIVFATHDGGLHWALVAPAAGEAVLSHEPSAAGLLPQVAQLSFVSKSTGWLVLGLYAPTGNGASFARGKVLVSHDGGVSWAVQPLTSVAPTGTAFDPPVFFGQLKGVMLLHGLDPSAGGGSVLFTTSDGGGTWIAHTLRWEYVASVEFVDANHGWALAGPAADFMKDVSGAPRTIALPLYHTDDGGSTWTPVNTNLALESAGSRVTDLHFVDQNVGFATIWNATGPTQFLKTVDGGRTWMVVWVCKSELGLAYPPPVC